MSLPELTLTTEKNQRNVQTNRLIVRESEKGLTLVANIASGDGLPYDLTDLTLRFCENKRDGKAIIDPAVSILDSKNGRISYILHSQAYACSGSAWFEILNGTTLVDSTQNFSIKVESTTNVNVDSSDYIGSLEAQLADTAKKAGGIVNQAKAVLDDIQNNPDKYRGVKGDTGTIKIGKVTAGPAPTVTNVGTASDATLDFTLVKGDKGDKGDSGFYKYSVGLTDDKYDRNKWYYVDGGGRQSGTLGSSSYFSLEAPLYCVTDVPYGTHPNGTGKDASARQTVLYGQSGWNAYNRKLIVLDDQTNWTTDGKRLLTFAVPSDNNLNYAFYARGGLIINIVSDVPGLTWTPYTDTFVQNGTTISVLNDSPDPKALGLDDDHTFWALPTSQLRQQFKDTMSTGDTVSRPTGISIGYQYFDTSLKKPVWYTGNNWVDATGATV